MRNVVFLTDGEAAPEVYASCAAACDRLRKEGAHAAVMRYAHDAVSGGKTDEALAFAKRQEADTLFLADSPVLLYALSEAGYAVVALQHADNASLSFSGARYIFSEPEEVDFDSYQKAWQRLNGLPWEILETKRLRVRETTVEDVDRLYEIYAMPGMTDYMEGLFPDPEDEKRYMRDYIENVYGLTGFGVWSVLEKESGALIGRAGFSVRNGFDNIELGFLIGTAWQGRGYAQEVCRAVLTYGRDLLGIGTVQALVKEGNTVSDHIVEKLGFSLAKTVRVEEDIYGGNYPPADAEGAHRVALSPARYGQYHLYLLREL